MKILLISNIVSHHQLPLCKSLINVVGSQNFTFATVGDIDEERVNIGWGREQYPEWVLPVIGSTTNSRYLDEMLENYDLVISGERLFDKLHKRANKKKLTYYMSERWWKPPIGKYRLLHPRFLSMANKFRLLCKYENFKYLSIGPYAARDSSFLIDAYAKGYKWGYFTAPVIPKNHNLKSSESDLSILWVGRMLEWKKVDLIIRAISYLQISGISLKLTLVGSGPEIESLRNLGNSTLFPGTFAILPPIHFEKIPDFMKRHDIYVLSSGAYEGWGAVVNESMSCGLTVVASKQSGAALALIEHGVNGFLFDSDDISSLIKSLREAIASDRQSIGKNANHHIDNIWSPDNAAERIIETATAQIECRSEPSYSTGPMSNVSDWL